MTALASQPASLLGVGFLALALAAALGAARVRAPLAMALCLAAAGAAAGAAIAVLGAPGAGLVAALALGAVGPLIALGAVGLVPGAARVRVDGPPLASLIVAVGLFVALIWAGAAAPPLAAPLPAAASPAQADRFLMMGLACFALAAFGAMALLGFGERAEALRPPSQRRLRRHRLPSDEDAG